MISDVRYQQCQPPSTFITEPVTKLASLDSKNAMPAAISLGSPFRCMHCPVWSCRNPCSFSTLFTMGVLIRPDGTRTRNRQLRARELGSLWPGLTG